MHNRRLEWDDLREQSLAAHGYHSPNQLLTKAHRLSPQGTASEQEAVATLVLSGAYVGFLPDHYADQFVWAGRMHAVEPEVFRYDCQFVCLRRRSPALSRAAKAFSKHLLQAHAETAIDPPVQ